MIRVDVQQGTPEWLEFRIGRPTCSGFTNLITPKTLKPSSQAKTYRNQLLAEWLLGTALDWSGDNGWMARGRELEGEARAYYEMQQDVDVLPGGFILRDDEQVGGSPDGLVGEDGGVELKCLAVHNHVGYMLEPETLEAAFHPQVQGYLYLTGRQWWDVVSYHPTLPSIIRRIKPDPEYRAALEYALEIFLVELNEAKERLAPHRMLQAT